MQVPVGQVVTDGVAFHPLPQEARPHASGVGMLVAELLRTSRDGAPITFDDGTTVTISGPAQVIATDGKAYPVREWSRRAALAGVTP